MFTQFNITIKVKKKTVYVNLNAVQHDYIRTGINPFLFV